MASGNIDYDFIVCGGGTTGCVVAARLAEESSFKVLLLEAGRDSKDVVTVQMAGGWTQNFGGKDDWNFFSEPSEGVNRRSIQCSHGKILGGSSSVNGTLCIRGPKQDYDDWKMEGWSGDDMYRYMAKSETFHTKEWFKADMEVHGQDGPLHLSPYDLAPISELVMQSYQEAGLPLRCDMFTTGETANGCGHAIRTCHDGLRSASADFLIDRSKRANLDIVFNATVDKITFDTTGDVPRATGVDVVLKDGTRENFRAGREIVVSGGAYCSPAILLRSGLGPKAELNKLEIPIVQELPGVGGNLLDHLLVGTCYEVGQPGLTHDHELFGEGVLAKSMQKWQKSRSGVMANLPFGAFAYRRLDEQLADSPLWKPKSSGRDAMNLTKDQPNVEYWNTECYGGPPSWTDFPTDGNSVFAMITLLLNGQSTGNVKLRSRDPLENPIVDHKYLADPLDALVLAEGARWANKMVLKGKATGSVIKGSWPAHLTHTKMESREEWIEYVKQEAVTCNHPAGSCKMGKKDDPTAVVDEKLRVYGTKSLRVADVSIMPRLNQGHPQMPAYGIGEKLADMLKAEYAGYGVRDQVSRVKANPARIDSTR